MTQKVNDTPLVTLAGSLGAVDSWRQAQWFFVELGALDGVTFSNTLFFERERGWNGICIEPDNGYFEQLKRNRRCFLSNDVAYSEAGQWVDFAFAEGMSGIVDGILPFAKTNQITRKLTNTLGNILQQFDAPEVMDYLSLDVEGQEINILRTFPHDMYKFRCITVEHNAYATGPEMQRQLRELLESKGYRYVTGSLHWPFEGGEDVDDFYVYPSLL